MGHIWTHKKDVLAWTSIKVCTRENKIIMRMKKEEGKDMETGNNLQLNVEQKSGVINADFDQLEAALAEKMSYYKGVTVSEESVVIGKKEVASLRKLKASIDTRRKEVKNAFMQPYNEFESKVKRLTTLIDEPIELINSQVQDFERLKKEEKKKFAQAVFKEAFTGLEDYADFDQMFNPKWLNASVSKKSVQDEVFDMSQKVKSDVEAINMNTSEAKEKALEVYKTTHDLTKAITYINQYENQKAEIVKREEERKRQAAERELERERQRIREEERARIRQEEEIKKQAEKEAVDKITQVDEEEATPLSAPESIKAIYTVVATPEEIKEVETALTSLGIYFERKYV